MNADSVFRVYFNPNEIGKDGYPHVWHHRYVGTDDIAIDRPIKDLVREQAGHRCARCHHPYRNGHHGSGEWSPCDEHCRHDGPVRYWTPTTGWGEYDGPDETIADHVEAQWRILTVHHLNGVKHDCRWWNLVALCQRCHLTIQGKVKLERAWDKPHSEWFKPYAAGWYASHYLGLELDRDETLARLDELLALEQTQEALW